MKEYALYRDDKFICMGTLKEIANYLGVTYGSIKTFKAKPYRYKYIFIELDD